MPKIKIRSMIRAPKGSEFLAFDLSQAESWVVAYEANEPRMKHALKYGDIHSETAVALFHLDKANCEHKWKDVKAENKKNKLCESCGVLVLEDERYLGKKGNHASAYGMKEYRQMETINAESDKPPFITVTLAEATQMNKRWHSYYNVRAWWANIQDELNKTRTLTTTYGRRRQFFQHWGDELFKEAYAFKPQSTVADHFNGRVHPQLGIRGGFKEIYYQHAKRGHLSICNHAHDSCLLLVPSPIPDSLIYEIRALLERPIVINGEEFTIPVDGERGERYGELEKIKWAA